MIFISKLPTGLLIQRDDAELIIDAAALSTALGPILHELLTTNQALAQARLSGYEAGLSVGHANGARETEARIRKEAEEFAKGLELLRVNAPLVA